MLHVLVNHPMSRWWATPVAAPLPGSGGSQMRGGGFARSWGVLISACCRPSRWNSHVTDHFLVCGNHRWANRQRK